MVHIANIFVGKSLENQAEDVLRKVAAQYHLSDGISQYCRFYHLEKTEGYALTKLQISGQRLFEETEVSKEQTTLADEDAVVDYWVREYSEMVQVGTVSGNAQLKLFVYLNLCDTDDCRRAISFVKPLATVQQLNFKVSFIGYDTDMVHAVFPSDTAIKNLRESAGKSRKMILDFGTDQQFTFLKNRFFVLQNTAMNSASYNFKYDTLSTILAEFILMCVENYDNLFPITVQPDHITGMGLSLLTLDKTYFVKYLMRRAYLKVLFDEGIEQKSVNRTEIDPIIQESLRNEQNLFSKFYEREITPLIEKGESHEDIVAAVTPKLEHYFGQLEDSLLAFLDNSREVRKADGTLMSIQEKQAALALLLNIDDKLLKGNAFDDNLLSVDDLFTEAASTLIESNNQLVERLENESEVVYIPGPVTSPADDRKKVFYPLRRMKELRRNILESTENIRKWEKQLESTEEVDASDMQSKRRLTKDGFVFDDVRYRLLGDKEEEPLAEVYDPGTTTPLKAVDLRQFFSPVKDQGPIGSCTTFAITSIYEYLLKKNKAEDPDLSERFVFYNTNVRSNQTDEGATFRSVIDAISQYGICNEDDCPYSTDMEVVKAEPSEDAFQKAQNHKIVEAKMVEVNHKSITSALTQGYPVAISLKLYNSFGSGYEGYELLPPQEEIDAGEYMNHAMVVCGYSEEDRIYIVRNSWGKRFGDNGYCYIPFSYIDNPELNSFCCIITKTKDGDVKGMPSIKTTVDLVKEDNKVLNILLKIKIEESKKDVDQMLGEYRRQNIAFVELIQTLGTTRIRRQITEQCETKLTERISEKNAESQKLKAEFAGEMNKTRRQWNKYILNACLGTISSLLLTALFFYVDWSAWLNWVFVALSILGVVAVIFLVADQRHRLVRKRKELNDRIASLGLQIQKLQKERTVTRLKHFLAAMIVDNVTDLKTRLTKKYHTVCSYVSNLSTWYGEEKANLNKMECDTQIPLVGLLDNPTLDAYFDRYGDDLMKDVRFSDFISSYDMSDDNIVEYRDMLKNKIITKLLNTISDFEIIRYLKEPQTYKYIDSKKVRVDTLLPQMNQLCLPFIQYSATAGNIQPSIYLFCDRHASDTNFMSRYFTTQPTVIPMQATQKIVVISTVELPDCM